jgi:hypothetical protein
MKHYLYSYGKPFGMVAVKSIALIKERIIKNKAGIIIVDGGVGEGKTTLATHLADEFQGSPIDFKKQYAFGGEQFQEKLQICYDSKLEVIIYDEAGDFSRRGALTEFNKRLVRVFETFRAFRIMVIVVLPNFTVLESSLFDLKIPRALFNCHNRTDFSGNFRAYSLYRMLWVRAKMQEKKMVIKQMAYSSVTPNFRGHFLDLPPDRSAELNKLCMEGKLNSLSDNILKSKGLVSFDYLMNKLNRSKVWLNAQLRKLRLKEKVVYKRKRYFEAGILETLRGQLQREMGRKNKKPEYEDD